MAARPGLALASLILTAGAVLLLFFVILAGAINSSPVNQVYFLRADTSGIKGAPKTSQWTLWNICDGSANGRNQNCGKVKAAYPFDPSRNFGTTDGLDLGFIGTHKFYYLSRFMFAFILMALFFAVCSLFTGLLALCSRIGGAISGLLTAFALFWQTLAAALMTACYVIGKNDFKHNKQNASVGTKAFAFMWTSMVCLLLSTILFFSILGTGKSSTYGSSKKGLFGRKRSTRSARSRGSFLDDNHRNKDLETSSFERAR